MPSLLTTHDLIARMTPTALAEIIASIEQAGNLDANERYTAETIKMVLVANVGEPEALELIDTAKG